MSTAGDTRIRASGLDNVIRQRFARSNDVAQFFFEDNASRVSITCLAMARRFDRGGRLLVFGTGAAATDAQHVSVEFVHPVLVGKRALPAIALTADAAALSGTAAEEGFARPIRVLGRPADIAMGISHASPEAAVARGCAVAGEAGLLCIRMLGAPVPAVGEHDFIVDSTDPFIVQEIQETLYHIFWELVHVFLDGSPA